MTNRDLRPFCKTQQGTVYTECKSKVVYKIPVSCAHHYIGQTGRCFFNERAKEHNLNVHNKTGGLLAEHCKQCRCTPNLKSTQFLKKARGRTEREIIEAFYIKECGDSCISKPSILHTDAEVEYLKGFLWCILFPRFCWSWLHVVIIFIVGWALPSCWPLIICSHWFFLSVFVSFWSRWTHAQDMWVRLHAPFVWPMKKKC